VSGFGPDDPFGGIPFLNDLARMLQSQGGTGGWESARQFAVQVATGGVTEANPDPMERLALQELARVAELHVGDATGLDVTQTGRPINVVPVTKAEWARRTIDAWRPLLERLASNLTGPAMAAGEDLSDDPEAAMLQPFVQLLGPVMLGLQAGSMVGHLASRSLGQYDLPIPRPPSDEIVIVAANVAAFGQEWSLPVDDLRLWICLSELATHAVIGVPHVRARLLELLDRHVATFSLDTSSIESALESFDPMNPESLQEALGDPTALLGAIQSEAKRSLLPELSAIAAVVVGYVDHVMDSVGTTLIGSYGMLTEALHRRRVEAAAADRFVENLLGLELGREQYERGEAFVQGVLERGGDINRLFMDAKDLPTPNEVDAPGLWLARIDL
jgi:putative hydrolase